MISAKIRFDEMLTLKQALFLQFVLTSCFFALKFRFHQGTAICFRSLFNRVFVP